MLQWVWTGKGRGWWRLVDLACPDKNIVRRALLTVFRGWDSHSSTPVRPPWQWLALFFSFPGPLCRWPACWRCQHKSGCSLWHNRSLASAHVGPLLFSIKSILGNICMAVLYPSMMALDYQRRACQAMNVAVIRVMQIWAFFWVVHIGQHLMSLNDAKLVSCHCVLKYNRMRRVYHRKGRGLIGAMPGAMPGRHGPFNSLYRYTG